MQQQTMRSIAERIAADHQIEVADLRGPGRSKRISHIRQQAMAEMLKAGFSTTQVGRFLGGRDHTTVVFGARQHAARSAEAAQ
jgi:chromosomal replication initiation ATPase DnaA